MKETINLWTLLGKLQVLKPKTT